MSEFAAEVRKIDKVWEHPNADRLALASVEGLDYQFVVGKDSYEVGDEVVYIPVDSLLPESLIAFLGLSGRLSGRLKNRVKTVKLRGEISQGLVEKTGALFIGGFLPLCSRPNDVTELLGIEKYEPPAGSMKHGNGSSLPDMVEIYDLESCQRRKRETEDLMDQVVYITEKLEGTHVSITKRRDSNEAVVSSRKHARGEESDYTTLAHKECLHEVSEAVRASLDAQQVTLRGEIIGPGIQGNIYKFQDRHIFLFDIKSDGHYVPPHVFYRVLMGLDVLLAPLLWEGVLQTYLNGRTAQEASNGTSKLADTLREGIVIRASEGRVILKQRSPEYLVKEK